MMTISLSETGKRFNRDWIFRKFSFSFISGNSYAITGPNGSGKSTLLQVIGGAITASEGNIQYSFLKTQYSIEQAFKLISISAPYLEVIEEMTITEFLEFHRKFKPMIPDLPIKRIIAIMGLEKAADKQIRYYSSGMKQRVKLAQALFTDAPCVLLDEPCTNLDQEGVGLYQQLVKDYCRDRLIIVSSNDMQEYEFCKEKISMEALKFNY